MDKINVSQYAKFPGHSSSIYSLAGGLEAHQFFSASGDGLVVMWDLNTKEDGIALAKTNSTIYKIHCIQEQKLLAIGQNNEGIQILDLERNKPSLSVKLSRSSIFSIVHLNEKLFVGTSLGELFIIDYLKAKVLFRIKISEKSLRSLALGQMNDILLIGSSDNMIYVFDVFTRTVVTKIPAHDNSIFSAKFISVDKAISAGRDAKVKYWSVDKSVDFDIEMEIPAHMGTINQIALSPDHKFFATCSMDKTIRIWRTKDGKLLKVIDSQKYDGHTSSVNCLLWSDYNNLLISASDDRTIMAWELNFDKK